MTKSEIRNEIKNRISALTQNELKTQSDVICKAILESRFYTSCTTLLAYMPLADEVDITPVIKAALKSGKTVFLPHVFPQTNKMEFYSYDANTETKTGAFGIKEPEIDETKNFSNLLKKMSIDEYSPAPHSSNYVDIEEPSQTKMHILILVPGRAFTKDGRRIGRGKGFYDIYLSNLPNIFDIKKSGVCFSQQLMANLPTTPDDVMMDRLYCPSI